MTDRTAKDTPIAANGGKRYQQPTISVLGTITASTTGTKVNNGDQGGGGKRNP